MRESKDIDFIKIIQNYETTGEIPNKSYETLIENKAYVLLKIISKMKLPKDSQEHALLDMIHKIIEVMDINESKSLPFHISATLKLAYLQDKLYVKEVDIPDASLDITLINDIQRTGEEWIRYFKQLYGRINMDVRNFHEEKMFWKRLLTEVQEAASFSLSDEFSYVIRMVREIGKLSIAFTLQSLASDIRIIRLCERFCEFYEEFDTTNFSINIERPADLQQDIFIVGQWEQASISIIQKLQERCKAPRIIRKSFVKCLNKLRDDLFKKTVFVFAINTPVLFKAFNNLALGLNSENKKEVSDSNISIDEVESVSHYTFELEQIEKILEIKSLINEWIIKDDVVKKYKEESEMIDQYLQIAVYEFKLKLIQDEMLFEPNCEWCNIDRIDTISFESSVVFNKTIEAITNAINTVECITIEEIALHLSKYCTLLKYTKFRDSIQDYIKNTENCIAQEIQRLGINKNKTLAYKTDQTKQQVADDLMIVGRMHAISNCFDMIKDFFSSENIILHQIKFIDELLEKYKQSLPTDCEDLFIMTQNEPIQSIIEADNSEHSFDVFSIQVADYNLFAIDETDIFIKKYNPMLANFIKWVKPRQTSIKEILDSYHEINREMLNRENTCIFTSEQLERLIRGLINLKWKYLIDSYFESLQMEFLQIYKRYQLYNRAIEEVIKTVIPSLIKDKEELNKLTITNRVTGIDENVLQEVLEYSSHLIGKGINEILEKMILNQELKLNVILDCQNIDSFGDSDIYISSENNLDVLRSILDPKIVYDKILRVARVSAEFHIDEYKSQMCNFIKEHVEHLIDVIKIFNLSIEYEEENIKDSEEDVIAGIVKTTELIQVLLKKQHTESLLQNMHLFLLVVKPVNINVSLDNLTRKLDFYVESYRSMICELFKQQIHLKEIKTEIDRFKISWICNKIATGFDLIKKSIINCPEFDRNIKPVIFLKNACEFDMKTTEGFVSFIKYINQDNLEPESIYKIQESYNIKSKKCLSASEIQLITQERAACQEEINRILQNFNNFKCDHTNFIPLYQQFKFTVCAIEKQVEMLNSILNHFKFTPIVFDINPIELEEEYQKISEIRVMLNEYYNAKLYQNPLFDALKNIKLNISNLFRLQLTIELKSEIDKICVPVSYIKLLSSDFITNEFFDNQMSLKQYIEIFDESNINTIIEKCKCDYQITNYLKSTVIRFEYEIDYKDTSIYKSIDIIKLPVITNFENCNLQLEQMKADFDLNITFNKFKMHMDDLQVIQQKLVSNEKAIKELEKTQERTLETLAILKAEKMDVEKIEYKKALVLYVNLIENINITQLIEIHSICTKINEILVNIETSIKKTLQTMRTQSNRLYFVSNNDLIKAMAEPGYVVHLLKLVFNINGLLIESDYITALEPITLSCYESNKTEEIVNLKYKVFLNESIPQVINNFQVSLQCTVLDYFINVTITKLSEIIKELTQILQNNEKSEEYVNRIRNEIQKHNEMCALLSKMNDGINSTFTLQLNQNYLFSNNKIAVIDDLIAEFYYYNNLTNTKSYKINRIMEFSEKYPTFNNLYLKPVLNNIFDWNQIKKVVDIKEAFAIIANVLKVGSFSYEFEYYPPTHFIFTSLTAKVYSNILMCSSKPGIILYGPSGTGKTETVKYFCRNIGKPLFVFCCNEKCDYSSIKNIITGCILTKNYICFDEFNRLSKKVMSAITELFIECKDSIKVFLTMNLGYKARSELPKSLKSLFGEVYVVDPDIKDVVVYHSGTDHIYTLLERLKKNCTADETYDFGLRAIRAIFTKNTELEVKADVCVNNAIFVNKTLSNDIIRLLYFYMATFIQEDKKKLIDGLKEVFNISISSIKIDVSYQAIFKMAISSRNSLIILGSVGKSSLINNMYIEMNTINMKNNKLMIYRYNPLNLLRKNDTVFGSINKNTKEWEDSRFLKDLRECLKKAESGWFVFDGPVLSSWIEDMNSLFDDNRILCLPTGEILKIPFDFKFIFETDNISNLTPATLTRMYLIKIHEKVEEENDVIIFESSVKETADDSEDTEMLLNYQKICLKRLKSVIATSNVIFLCGKCGIGKKRIIEAFDPDFAICRSENLEELMMSNKTVVIERFETKGAAVHEQVREYWEYETIGNIKYGKVKLICCIDEENAILSTRLRRIKKIHVKDNIEDINEFIEWKTRDLFANLKNCNIHTILSDEVKKNIKICKDFVVFITKMYNYTVGNIAKFFKLLKVEYLNNSVAIQDYLNFIYKLSRVNTCDEDNLCKNYLGKLAENTVKDVIFIGVFENKHPISIFESLKSKLLYLISIHQNITIRGSRMSGKRTILKETLKSNLISNNLIKIHTWDVFLKCKQFDYQKNTNIVNVYVLCDEDTPIDEKYLNQTTYEITMPKNLKSIDIAKTQENGCLFDALVVSNTLVNENHRNEPHSAVLYDITVPYDQISRNSLKNTSKILTFDNFFKAVNFYYNFKHFTDIFKKRYEERRLFLINALQSINQFELQAKGIKETIKNKTVMLTNRKDELKTAISTLQNITELLKEKKDKLHEDRKRLDKELEVCEEKRKQVKDLLEEAEIAFEQSKQGVSMLNKAQLSEIRTMNNPPEIFRKTIEFTYFLLENTEIRPEWSVLQSYLKKDDFIIKILGFESADIKTVEFVNQKFVSVFSVEKAEKVSRTCSALHHWISSVVKREMMTSQVQPLRNEIIELEMKLEEAKKAVEQKEIEFKENTDKLKINKTDISEKTQENDEIEKSIVELKAQLDLLETVIDNFKLMNDKWKHIEYNEPIKYILNSENVLETQNEIFVNANTMNSKELAEITNTFVKTSLTAPCFTNVINNAIYFKNDILIKDVDCFDSSVYLLIKGINSRLYENYNNSEFHGFKSQKVILQGNFANFYQNETFLYSNNKNFRVERSSSLQKLENELLFILNGNDLNLKKILEIQNELERERNELEKEKSIRKHYEILNWAFAQLSNIFEKKYNFSFSFNIFKEFIEKNDLMTCSTLSDSTTDVNEQIVSFFKFSFKDSLCCNETEIELIENPKAFENILLFDIKEILAYQFDYTFVTDFNNILFELKQVLSFDIEISAGSFESNSSVISLLKEQGNKLILVKNIQFLPACIKTGTNRFIYVIETNNHHPLINNTRIVYCDKNGSFDVIYKNIYDLMKQKHDLDDVKTRLIKFHALGMSLGIEHTIRDLEICFECSYLGFDFLVDMIYFSKLTSDVQSILRIRIIEMEI